MHYFIHVFIMEMNHLIYFHTSVFYLNIVQQKNIIVLSSGRE